MEGAVYVADLPDLDDFGWDGQSWDVQHNDNSPFGSPKEMIDAYLRRERGADEAMQSFLADAEIKRLQLSSVRDTNTSLMFTDIVNSTSIFERFGDDYAYAMVQVHDRIVQEVTERCGGWIIKHLGDGMLACFDTCDGAVKASVMAQQHLLQHNDMFPLLPLHVRIGINVGEVIENTEGDVFGASVNLAARICNLADADRIYTTGIVRARCERLPYGFKHLGQRNLKGFSNEIPVWEIEW